MHNSGRMTFYMRKCESAIAASTAARNAAAVGTAARPSMLSTLQFERLLSMNKEQPHNCRDRRSWRGRKSEILPTVANLLALNDGEAMIP
jgi:hypothetical protein